ncbi:hypothetical protein BDE02_14G144600 [Populus trichocarpa]|nr:hypothetical protein BDE02_14G144600 [Populus trichocarpa]
MTASLSTGNGRETVKSIAIIADTTINVKLGFFWVQFCTSIHYDMKKKRERELEYGQIRWCQPPTTTVQNKFLATQGLQECHITTSMVQLYDFEFEVMVDLSSL